METISVPVTELPQEAQIVTLKEQNAPSGRDRLAVFSAENIDLKSEEDKNQIVEALCGRALEEQGPKTIAQRSRPPEVIKCPLCPDLTFKEPRMLYGHLRKHAGVEDTFRCGFCERKFESLAKRAKHERVHKEFEAAFKCDICSLGFLRYVQ